MHQFRKIENDLYIGPQPSEDDLTEAKRRGIKTVIDFRLPNETATDNENLATRIGLDYVNIPVNKSDLSVDQVAELDRIMQEKEKPFLIHCGTGMRAAMLLSLVKAQKNQWSAQRTFDEARSMGCDIESSPDFSAFVRSNTKG